MRASKEISWVLEGRSPDQIPMARLAEYMQQLAIMLGETENVHFARIEKGCARLVAKLNPGYPAQRVYARVYAVRDRRAPAEAMRAFRRINDMVGEERRHAHVTFGACVILRFPGNVTSDVAPFSLVENGTITGKLYALIEQPSGLLNARIRPQGGNTYVSCSADNRIGRQLRNYFLDAVRVQGMGTWVRSENGEWLCQSLHILDVHPVIDVSLREAINALRAVDVEWSDDPLGDWVALDEADLDERNGAA
jgi:hypothetical protein